MSISIQKNVGSRKRAKKPAANDLTKQKQKQTKSNKGVIKKCKSKTGAEWTKIDEQQNK